MADEARGRRHRADQEFGPRGPRRARAQGGRRRRRRAGHGRRRRRRPSSPRSPAELDLPILRRPGRHAQPLRAGPRGRPRRRRRRARSRRRRRRAPRHLAEGRRARLRQQRVPGPLRGGRPSTRATATRSYARSSTRCPTSSDRVARSRPALARPGGRGAPLGAAILVSSNRYRLAVRSGRAHGLGSTTACSGSRSSADLGRGAGGRRDAAHAGARGPLGLREVDAGARSRPASTARRSSSTHRCDFQFRPGVLRVRIARAHPGASPSANGPEACGTPSASSCASRSDASTNPITEERRVWIWIEITDRERLGREEAAARLHAIADMLARHIDVRVRARRDPLQGARPRRGRLQARDREIETDERELEIELKW